MTYSTELKTKLVIEVLKGENNIIPKNLQNRKAKFLANAELAMEPSKAVKEYKDENTDLKDKLDE